MQRDDQMQLAPVDHGSLPCELERLAGLRVPHPNWIEAREEIFDLHALRRARQEGSGILIIGESGVGKSALLESIELAFPRREESDRTVVPCLLTKVPPRPTIRSTAREFLRSLGDPLASAGKEDAGELKTRLVTQLQGCRTELILVDEVGHLISGRRNDSVEHLGNFLKTVADESRAPLVLAGLPESEELRRANPAIRRRFSASIELTVASLDVEKPNLRAFRSVLKSVESHLPLPAGSNLKALNTARRLLFATEGRMGPLMALLQRAVRICRRGNHSCISHDVLALAFTRQLWRAAPTDRNPFHSTFNWKRLIGAHEPFEPAHAVTRRRRGR